MRDFREGTQFGSLMAGVKRRFLLLAVAWALILLDNCAPVKVKPTAPPLDRQDINRVIAEAREQEQRVKALFASGTVTFRREDSGSKAHILIAGTRDPLKIKIELTHPWGRPLLHMVIKEKGVEILSFTEKRYYLGTLKEFSSWKLFPGPLKLSQMWGLARGYPSFPDFADAFSAQGNRITLLNHRGETAASIELYPEKRFPRVISFPQQGMVFSYSDYEVEDGIYHARTIQCKALDGKRALEMKVRQSRFNKTIPEEVFRMEKPEDFKTCYLRAKEGP